MRLEPDKVAGGPNGASFTIKRNGQGLITSVDFMGAHPWIAVTPSPTVPPINPNPNPNPKFPNPKFPKPNYSKPNPNLGGPWSGVQSRHQWHELQREV